MQYLCFLHAFINYISRFGSLDQQQIDLICNKASEIAVSKDDFYWEAGKAVKQIGFLTDGVLRVYHHNKDDQEVTRYFIEENHLILAGDSPGTPYVPSEYLSAVTNCRMVVFSIADWESILDAIPQWNTIVQSIITEHHKEKISRRSELVSQDATERYQDFLEKFPNLLNRIPLSYIASYLGITQSSLSRIRKKTR